MNLTKNVDEIIKINAERVNLKKLKKDVVQFIEIKKNQGAIRKLGVICRAIPSYQFLPGTGCP